MSETGRSIHRMTPLQGVQHFAEGLAIVLTVLLAIELIRGEADWLPVLVAMLVSWAIVGVTAGINARRARK